MFSCEVSVSVSVEAVSIVCHYFTRNLLQVPAAAPQCLLVLVFVYREYRSVNKAPSIGIQIQYVITFPYKLSSFVLTL